MASLLTKLRDYLGFGEEDDWDEYDEEPENELDSGRALRELNRPLDGSGLDGQRQHSARVTNLTEVRTNISREGKQPVAVSGGKPVKLVAMQPKEFDDCRIAADHLINGRPLILNLEGTDKETATRIIHFLHGVVYTLRGSVQRLTKQMFVFTPHGVDVDRVGMYAAADQDEARDRTVKSSFSPFGSLSN